MYIYIYIHTHTYIYIYIYIGLNPNLQQLVVPPAARLNGDRLKKRHMPGKFSVRLSG